MNDIFKTIELENKERVIDPSEILVQQEQLNDIEESLELLLRELSDNQQKIFLLSADGYSDVTISKMLDIPQTTVSRNRRIIPMLFDKLVSDEAIEDIKSKLEAAKRCDRKAKLKKEYNHRIALKTAMNKLLKYLSSRPSLSEPIPYGNNPRFTFEQQKNVYTGTHRARVSEGYTYITDTVCRIPEYLTECGLAGTVCTLCNNCKRIS